MKQKKAKWDQITHFLKNDEYICSECGYNAKKPFKKCPGCSSQMKGTNYDPEWVDEMDFLDWEDD